MIRSLLIIGSLVSSTFCAIPYTNVAPYTVQFSTNNNVRPSGLNQIFSNVFATNIDGLVTATGGNVPILLSDFMAKVTDAVLLGADPTGVQDSSARLKYAELYAMTNKTKLYIPAGTYKITTNLYWTNGVSIFGVPGQTIIKPTSVVTNTAIIVNSVLDASLGNRGKRITISGITVDGTSANTNILGMHVGSSIVNSHVYIENCMFLNFTGTNGIGLGIGQIVSSMVFNTMFYGNTYGVRTINTNLSFPTTLTFLYSQFTANLTNGFYGNSGAQVSFPYTIFEINGREGAIVKTGPTNTAINYSFPWSWFEGNWYSLLGNPDRTNRFSLSADGTAVASGCQIQLFNTEFVGGPTVERAVYNNAITDLIIDHVKVYPQAGQIYVETNCIGFIKNWDINNSGAVLTTVSNKSLLVYPERSYFRFSDGTTTATASSPNSPFRFRAGTNNIITATVGDDDLTYGDNLLLQIFPGNILHSSLGAVVGNEHINHTNVVLSALGSIDGGGDITTSRYFQLDGDADGVLAGFYYGTPANGTNKSFYGLPTGGTNIFISTNTTRYVINYSGTNESSTASNLGTGNGVFNNKTGFDLQFNSLAAGSNITISSNANTLTIAGTASGGEANTGSNLGSGLGVYNSKSSVDLRFNSMAAGIGVSISSNANMLTYTHNIAAGTNTVLTTNGSQVVINSSAASSGGITVTGETFNKTGGLHTNGLAYALVDFPTGSALSVTLPSSGTYLVTASVDYYAGGSTFVQYYKFRNTTDASDVANSELELSFGTTSNDRDNLFTMGNIVTVAASKVIAVYSKTSNVTYDHRVNSTNSWVRYLKLQ